MSQILVTGEAKIRDIQGPVVANSGVITALDGAANQYVRGDGTLAIFPSSSGGGSSVSYYLNGSVNQGTFGGSTYYQMSRNAIVGTGTNFSTSSDGLIAQFITDANDPDVVSIPSGNWNVEFFMNVSASSGALASFYVEIYKYNGSTFTLLATNVATPEQLTNTTTVDAYFTSVAMPLSAMAVTDRLAVRIFANVASKTVTLYTEDNRLCQIVTTFSNGLTSLNNLTDQSQYLATGTSGTDFNIVSSGDTHTFNIPSASASNRGLITTGSQTIAGIKTLSVPSQFEQGLYLKQNMNLFQAGYIGLGASTTGLIVGLSGGGFGTLNFNNTTSFTYTFPNATGTIALTSDLSSYVPYTGATGDVNLGLFSIISNRVSAIGDNSTYGGTLSIKQNNVRSLLGTGYTELFGKTNLLGISFGVGSIANLSNSVLTAERTYTLPDLSGTLALLEGTQTFSGSKTFSTGIKAESGIFLKELSSSGRLTGYVGISATATGGMQQIQFLYPVSGSSVFSLPTTGAYNYEFPIVSGTIALTSDLSSYLPLTGGTLTGGLNGTTATFSGLGTFYQLTMTGATAGRIFYAQTGGVVSQSGNLNWNETNGMLGVGTPNPSAVITAFSNNAATQFKASGNAPAFTFSESLTTSTRACVFGLATAANQFITGTAAGDMAIANQSTVAGAIVFGTGTTERMRMSSSGNFGIGTGNPLSKLHVNTGTNQNFRVRPGTDVGATNGVAINSRTDDDGSLQQLTLRASDVIMLTSGNVGIGTSSTGFNAAGLPLVAGSGSGNTGLTIFSGASSFGSIHFADAETTGSASFAGYINYGHTDNSMQFGTSATERMRITSGGNVGIGTSSPDNYYSTKLVVAVGDENGITIAGTGDNFLMFADGQTGLDRYRGFIHYSHDSNFLAFGSDATERMRITSGGNVGFNGSSDVANVNDKFSLGYFNSNYGWLQTWSSTPLYLNKLGNAVYAGSVRLDTLSDERVKDNIQPIENALSKVLSITGKKFHLKDEDESKIRYGFIAQELEGVLDEFVIQTDITFKHKELEVKNVKSIENWASSWAALLVEAIKEQQAQIEELKALINK